MSLSFENEMSKNFFRSSLASSSVAFAFILDARSKIFFPGFRRAADDLLFFNAILHCNSDTSDADFKEVR